MDITGRVDMPAFLQRMGIALNTDFVFEDMGKAAILTTENGLETITIWVNPMDTEERQREASAMALAILFEIEPDLVNTKHTLTQHAVKPASLRVPSRDFPNTRQSQRLAFVKTLLMSKDKVLQAANSLADQHRDPKTRLILLRPDDFVKILSRLFGVTQPLMTDRLKDLQILPS